MIAKYNSTYIIISRSKLVATRNMPNIFSQRASISWYLDNSSQLGKERNSRQSRLESNRALESNIDFSCLAKRV